MRRRTLGVLFVAMGALAGSLGVPAARASAGGPSPLPIVASSSSSSLDPSGQVKVVFELPNSDGTVSTLIVAGDVSGDTTKLVKGHGTGTLAADGTITGTIAPRPGASTAKAGLTGALSGNVSNPTGAPLGFSIDVDCWFKSVTDWGCKITINKAPPAKLT